MYLYVTYMGVYSLIHSQEIWSWTWWLMPLIPALWEAEVGGSPEVGRSRPAWPTWPTWRNLVSTKNIKLAVVLACSPSYSGGWGRRIAWTWKVEVMVSQDHTFRSEEHTSELQSHSEISYAVFCLKKKKTEFINLKGLAMPADPFLFIKQWPLIITKAIHYKNS